MCPTNAVATDRTSSWKSFPGLRVREVRYRGGAVQRCHRHAESSLSLVIAGQIEETSPVSTYRALAGSLVVKPADCLHADSYGPSGAHVVQIIPQEEGELWDDARWTYRWHEAPQFARSILSLIAGTEESAELVLWELLGSVFAHHTRQAGHPPGWWADTVDLLNTCCDQSISVGSVARRVGVHPVHLARVCRRQFGCTTRQYIRQRRVLAAWRDCQRAENSLAVIAARTGFADQAHMTRAFTEVLGISPARLRRLTAG